jgi:PAS domain S-box-containing protein
VTDKLKTNGSFQDLEFKFRHKSGEVKWGSFSAEIITIKNERCIITTLNDITEHKKSEEALRKNKEKLNLFMNSATESFGIYDSSLNLIEINKTGLKWWPAGAKKDDILGKNIVELAPNLKDSERYQQYLDVIRTGKPMHVSDIIPHPKFGNVYLDVKAFKVGDGMGLITHDVTERKQAELVLKEKEKILNETGKIAKIGGWELDTQTLTMSWTKETHQIHEVSEDYIPPLDQAYDYYHPDDRSIVETVVENALNNKEPYDEKVRFITAKGKHLVVRIIGRPHLIDGKVVKLSGIIQDITTYIQAEKALKDSKEHYRVLFESSRDAILVLDPEVGYIDCNYAAMEMFRIPSKAELTKLDPVSLSPEYQPDGSLSAEKAKELINRALKEGSGYEEWTHIRLDGVEFPSTISATRLYWDDRVLMQGTIQDITKRKQAEEALKNSEFFFSQMFEQSTTSTCLYNPEGTIIRVNPAFCKLFRIEDKTIIEGKFNEFKNRATIEAGIAPFLREIFNEKKTKNWETNYDIDVALKSKGQRSSRRGQVILEVFGYPIVDSDGHLKYVVLQHYDITERKQAEEALKESEDKYRRLVESTADWIWSVDIDNKITFTNNAVETLLGYKREEVMDSSYYPLIHPDDDVFFREMVQNSVNQKSGWTDIAIRWLHKEGAAQYFESSAQPIFDDKGILIGFNGINRDITERKQSELKLQQTIEELNQLKNRLKEQNTYLQEEIEMDHNFGMIIGKNKKFLDTLKQAQQVAASNTSVLILGETGTGKEVLARIIHNISDRKEQPLVKVNCAALPANLINSELFGHDKGAYTGAASRHIGRFELADKGTIFLDEVGDLPLELQAKLLRVLQESEFERLGSSKTLKVDVRVLTATNRNLVEMCAEGKFRKDLYYRLNVFPITSIPLREKKDDISSLTQYLVDKFNKKTGKSINKISKSVINTLTQYDWPGNVRELENVIERAVILSPGDTLQLGDFLNDKANDHFKSPVQTLDEMQKAYIIEILKLTGGRVGGVTGAARLLGLKPTTMQSRMKKLGIRTNKYSDINDISSINNIS